MLWRHRVGWSVDSPGGRSVNIEGKTLTIYESGKKVVRFPGNRVDVAVLTNELRWDYSKFHFKVVGINAKLLGKDHVHAATHYDGEETIPVVRIKGENIITTISLQNSHN